MLGLNYDVSRIPFQSHMALARADLNSFIFCKEYDCHIYQIYIFKFNLNEHDLLYDKNINNLIHYSIYFIQFNSDLISTADHVLNKHKKIQIQL